MLTTSRCKHMCCREGVDKAPKAPKAPSGPKDGSKVSQTNLAKPGPSVSKQPPAKQAARHPGSSEVEVVDLTSGKDKHAHSGTGSGSLKSLEKLHSKIVNKPPTLLSSSRKSTAFSARGQEKPLSPAKGQQKPLSFLSHVGTGSSSIDKTSSDYDAEWIEDLPSPSVLLDRAEPDLLEDASFNDAKTWPEDEAAEIDIEASGLEYSPPPTAQEQPVVEDRSSLPTDDMFVDSGLERDEERLERMEWPRFKAPETATKPALDERSTSLDTNVEAILSPIRSPRVLHFPRTGTGHNKGEISRRASPSPPRKRQRVDNDGSTTEVEVATEVDVPLAPPNQPPVDACSLRPWDDMTGIDMEFLASIADIVEFV